MTEKGLRFLNTYDQIDAVDKEPSIRLMLKENNNEQNLLKAYG
jgi:hypothetical protein